MAKKIVVVTDVRFWRRQSGAEQRIFSLTQYLCSIGNEVLVCFTGKISAGANDAELIDRYGLTVHSLIDDWQPGNLWGKIVWQVKCICNALWPSRSMASVSKPRKTLKEFRDPETRRRFHGFIFEEQPDVVIVEYITLGYLISDNRDHTKYAVDTHDLLHDRSSQFRANQLEHWIDVTAEEESIALSDFDMIIAIQQDEATKLSRLVNGKVPVIVAGHPADSSMESCSSSEGIVRFGILASGNQANQLALGWFLENVWRNAFSDREDVVLIVAGSISKLFFERELPKNVHLKGRVEELRDFYGAIDVAINPTQLGTGLKIKSIEALSFGKPLVSTNQGLEGIQVPDGDVAWRCCSNVSEWISSMQVLIGSEGLREQLSASARAYASDRLTPSRVFSELKSWLDTI